MATYGGGINQTFEFLNVQTSHPTAVPLPNQVMYQAPDNGVVDLDLYAFRWVSGIVQLLSSTTIFVVPFDASTGSWNAGQASKSWSTGGSLVLATPGSEYYKLRNDIISGMDTKEILLSSKIHIRLNAKDRLYVSFPPNNQPGGGVSSLIGTVIKYISSF